MVDFYGRFLVLRQTKVPVIGVINGAAIGAGLCLALGGCDIRYAQVKAKMGMTFVKLGLHPGMAGTHFLPRLTSPSIAAELLLTGAQTIVTKLYDKVDRIAFSRSIDQWKRGRGLWPCQQG